MADQFDISSLRKKGRHSNYVEKIIRNAVVRNCIDYFAITKDNGKKGSMLIERLQEPAKGYIWPEGGAQLSGFKVKEGLGKLVYDGTGLTATKIIKISGTYDFFWEKGPSGQGVHDKGTAYLVWTEGTIDQQKLKKAKARGPFIITPENYPKIRDHLHTWTRAGTDRAMAAEFGMTFNPIEPYDKEEYWPDVDIVNNQLIKKILTQNP